MKKLTMYMLIILLFGLFSCREIKKPNDLKNCVVLIKTNSESHNYSNFIRYMNLNDSTEYCCDVSKYWSDKWNIGDTIK